MLSDFGAGEILTRLGRGDDDDAAKTQEHGSRRDMILIVTQAATWPQSLDVAVALAVA